MKHVLLDNSFDTLENPIVKYIRRNPIKTKIRNRITKNIITDNQNNPIYRKKGGNKIGVLVAGIDPANNELVVGFSLCCKKDKFDYISIAGGRKMKINNFGRNLAAKRAFLWKNYDKLRDDNVHNHKEVNFKNTVVIPESISNDLEDFLNRCNLYYKDIELPVWGSIKINCVA